MNKINIDKVKRLYFDEKLSLLNTAKALGTNTYALCKMMREHNLNNRSKSEAMSGRKFSFEHRRKIAEANRGRTLTAKTREKISNAKKGKKLSPEHCKKLSEAGRDKKLSLEHRQKIAAAVTASYTEELRDVRAKQKKGTKHSVESRRKMSVSQKIRFNRIALKFPEDCTSHTRAKEIYKRLLDEFKKDQRTSLNFADIKDYNITFFKIIFGRLVIELGWEHIKTRLRMRNIESDMAENIKKILAQAEEERREIEKNRARRIASNIEMIKKTEEREEVKIHFKCVNEIEVGKIIRAEGDGYIVVQKGSKTPLLVKPEQIVRTFRRSPGF